MPSFLGDGGSGMDTEAVVEKLYQLERRPLLRIEQQQKELEFTNGALEELRNKVKKLQDNLKELYSFDAAFLQKSLLSYPEGYIGGYAQKNAEPGIYKLKINKLAQSLSLGSKRLPLKHDVSSGTIKIGELEADFDGGSVKEFKTFLNTKFEEILTARVIKVNSKEQLLTIEWKAQGLESVPEFSDPDNILNELGVYREANPDNIISDSGEELKDFPLSPARLSMVAKGPFSLNEQEKTIRLGDGSRRKLTEPPAKLDKRELKAIRLNVTQEVNENKEPDEGPFEVEKGPKKTLNIQGVILESYNLQRKRTAPDLTKEEPKYGIVLHYPEISETIELQEKGSLQEIEVKNDLIAVEFYAEKSLVSFKDLKYVYQIDPAELERERKKQLQKLQFPNLIREASDAELDYEGVKITRSSNEKIDDLIEGLSLDLYAESEQPIEFQITNNTEKSEQQIEAFIEAYNELLVFCLEASKPAEGIKAGEYDKMKQESGILVTNSTVRRLITDLRGMVSKAYPAARDPMIRTLPRIGISSGKVGQEWADIKKGLLVLDKNLLRQMLLEHPEAVQEFFALDSNADRRLDSGFAYESEQILNNYSKFSRGIIITQINSNKERMKQNQKSKQRVEEHAENYKDKMKAKFGYMESNVRQQKSTGNYLKNRLGGNNK